MILQDLVWGSGKLLHQFIGEIMWRVSSHFTACRSQLKTMVLLGVIHQRKKYTLREYIEKSTKEVFKGANDKVKCWTVKKGMRLYCMFRENLDLKESVSMRYILSQVQSYINYEEKLPAEDFEWNTKTGNGKQGYNKHREEREK